MQGQNDANARWSLKSNMFFLKPLFNFKNAMKQQALRILQQKRMYENQRGMMMQQSFNMEQTNFATESVKDTLVTVSAMKAATKDLKSSLRQMDIDKIEVIREFMYFFDSLAHARRFARLDG